MRAERTAAGAALMLMAALLAGCGEGGLSGVLRASGVGSTPDEFLVLPTKPLELPADMAALPAPTPGARNRVDLQPEADAVAALTGRPAAAGTANAAALVARAGPAAPNIRATVASEDAVYRNENRGRLLERIANNQTDLSVYRGQRLDANAEFARLRARGVRVPAAPPLIE